jgi:hypothetical protein
MAFNTVPTVSTGDSWSASQHNTYIRDNLAALWVGVAGGDMDYYSAANTKARLGKPSVASLLQMDGGGVPSWLTRTAGKFLAVSAAGAFEFVSAIDDIGSASNYGAQSSSDTVNWTDITGLSITLTLSKAGYIFVCGNILMYTANPSYGAQFIANINGVDSTLIHRSYDAYPGGSTLFDFKAGVSSGTKIVKVRFRSGQSGIDASTFGGSIVALAIP